MMPMTTLRLTTPLRQKPTASKASRIAGKLSMITVDQLAIPTGLAMPEAKVVGLEEARDGGFTSSAVREIRKQAKDVDVVVAGPGMASSKTCLSLAEELLKSSAEVVLDAATFEAVRRRLDREGVPL